MAAVTHLASYTNTALNAAAYTTGAVVPAVGDLLVVYVAVAASVSANPTLTESAGGGTYTRVADIANRVSGDALYCFVRNTLCENTTSRTLTWTSVATDASTNCILVVAKVTGMSRAGTGVGGAVLQFKVTDLGTAATTPSSVFANATLTTNPVIGAVHNQDNAANITPPASFVELLDTGTSVPNNGLEYASRDSGHTSATITWGSTSATSFGVFSLELDASAPAVTAPPRQLIVTEAVHHSHAY